MAKGASSKFPLCVVLMELAVQQEARNVRLDPEWVPRYANEEADAANAARRGNLPEERDGTMGTVFLYRTRGRT